MRSQPGKGQCNRAGDAFCGPAAWPGKTWLLPKQCSKIGGSYRNNYRRLSKQGRNSLSGTKTAAGRGGTPPNSRPHLLRRLLMNSRYPSRGHRHRGADRPCRCRILWATRPRRRRGGSWSPRETDTYSPPAGVPPCRILAIGPATTRPSRDAIISPSRRQRCCPYLRTPSRCTRTSAAACRRNASSGSRHPAEASGITGYSSPAENESSAQPAASWSFSVPGETAAAAPVRAGGDHAGR